VVRLFTLPKGQSLGHRPEAVGGIMERECADLLTAFFEGKR